MQAYPDLMETLLTLSDDPTLLTLDSIHMARLERWTVVMYSKSSGCSRVNNVRRQLFTHGSRTLDHIPPHTKRCFNMQSELCTRQVTSGDKQGSDTKRFRMLQAWGWTQDVNTKLWVPFWTVLDDVSKAVNVERRAEETANVPEQESSALFCVTVKAGASTTMECKLCDATNTDICD